MKTKLTLMILAFAAATSAAALSGDRAMRARQNYDALVAGTRQIGSLTPQELADIAELDRILRNKADRRTPSQRCIDNEIGRAGGSVSRLTRRVIDMKCREAGD